MQYIKQAGGNQDSGSEGGTADPYTLKLRCDVQKDLSWSEVSPQVKLTLERFHLNVDALSDGAW